jgi:hypothetical protein
VRRLQRLALPTLCCIQGYLVDDIRVDVPPSAYRSGPVLRRVFPSRGPPYHLDQVFRLEHRPDA